MCYRYIITITVFIVTAQCVSWNELELNLTSQDYDRAPWEVTGKRADVDVGLILSDLKSITLTELQTSFHLIQRWVDRRLVFDPASVSPFKYTLLDHKLFSTIWMPDLYVSSAVSATQHSVTQPNSFLRIYPNGTLVKSERLTVRFLCPLSHHGFPHSNQPCSMKLKSYSFTDQEVLLRWYKERTYMSEFVSSGVTVRSFDLKKCVNNLHGDNQPCLEIRFNLVKDFQSYIIRIYVPSALVVVLAWLSMWLDRAQVGARTSLGVLCVVSILTQSLGVMVMIPDAQGMLAVDIWMGVCMLFVTVSLFLFAVVHNMGRRATKQKAAQKYKKEDEESGIKTEEGRGRCTIRPAVIQNIARVVYPLAFIIFNLVYWFVFLT